MMQPTTTDPSQDPEVRRRLMQQLAQPTTASPARTSPTFATPTMTAGSPAAPMPSPTSFIPPGQVAPDKPSSPGAKLDLSAHTFYAPPTPDRTFQGPTTPSPNTGVNGGSPTPPLTVAPPAAPQPPQAPAAPTSFGNTVYDQIAAIFRSYGVEPTLDKVSQWGPNVDATYMQAIRQKIAEQFGKGGPQSGPNGTTPTTATTPTPTVTGNGDFAGAGKAWLASGGKTPADLKAFFDAHPEYGATISGSHGDKVTMNGRTFDGILAAGEGGRGATWNEILAGGGGGSAPASGSASNAWLDDIRAQLRARMTADQGPVDENAPQIAQALGAARLEGDRSMATERKALAERLYAQGGGNVSGNELSQGLQQSAERNATGMSQLRANLIMNEYQARRSDLNDAMQQALASGDAQMAREVQTALAQLDAQLRREGYGINMAQFAQTQNNTTVNRAAGA